MNDLPKLQYNGPEEPLDKYPTLEDIGDTAGGLQDEETENPWGTEKEEKDETESRDGGAVAEKREEVVDAESKVTDEIELVDFMGEFEERRKKTLTDKTNEKNQRQEPLRQLIRVEWKRDNDDVSEERPITPEIEDLVSDRVSTESSIHPCLREIGISDSQLKLVNPYTVYPVPNDPGLLPALWLIHERPPIYSVDGVQKFHDLVKCMGLRSIGPLKDMLLDEHVNLRYYGFRSPVTRAICDALANNVSVRKLDLKDNKLSPEGCGHLNDLLLRNSTITDLSLSGCRIGANGASRLYDAISENATLKTLDLSGCDLGKEGFGYIASALSNNQDIESVNLFDNHLDETCSEDLHDLLSRSEGLLHLDLSWNSLHSAETWRALVDGLRKNQTLRSLNLSWNALNTECVPHLHRLLTNSQNIEKLDLSWNKFIEHDAEIIAKALSKNSTLQELHLGNNPLRAKGALALIHAITPKVSPDSALCLLDLEDIWASKNVLQNLEMIEELRPWVTVKLGGILGNHRLIGPNVRRILLMRANYEAMLPKRKKQRRNFGHFVMSLKNPKLSRERFTELVKAFKLKLSTSLLNEIMNVFEKSKNIVDSKQLKSFYLEEYPETTAPLNLKKKKKRNRRKTKN